MSKNDNACIPCENANSGNFCQMLKWLFGIFVEKKKLLKDILKFMVVSFLFIMVLMLTAYFYVVNQIKYIAKLKQYKIVK